MQRTSRMDDYIHRPHTALFKECKQLLMEHHKRKDLRNPLTSKHLA
jgi:hypothetical protein